MNAESLLAVIRDLSIIFFAMIAVFTMLTATIMGLYIYRKVAPTLDAAQTTVKNAQEVTSQLAEKVVKPLIGTSTRTFTAGRIVAFILGLSRGQGGNKNGK